MAQLSSSLPSSTLSSGLNSLAAVVLSDIIKFFYRKPLTDKQDLRYSKILCKLMSSLCSLSHSSCFMHSTRLWSSLYPDHLFGFSTGQSSSSCTLSVRRLLGSDQCHFYDRILSPLDQLDRLFTRIRSSLAHCLRRTFFFQGALVGLIVSVIVQVWIFFGSQILRHQMRSFRLPTRLDGCHLLYNNITLAWNETMLTTAAPRVVQ